MEFIGKGNLIGNIYDRIILEEDNETCVIKCEALSKSKFNYTDFNLVGNFASSLDSLDTDYEKLLAIIDYFINYNDVSFIYDKVNVKGLNGLYIKVGNEDRELLLKLNKFDEVVAKIKTILA